MSKLIALLIVLLPVFGFCQTGYELYNGGTTIYVQKGALLTVQGTFINGNDTSGGTMVNDGILEVQGDFENVGSSSFTYSDTSSTDRVVKFTGTGLQNIEGSISTSGSASFYNLVVDKGNSTDLLAMQTQVTIDGSLVFGTATGTSTYTPSTEYTTTHNKGFIQTYNDSTEYLLTVANGNTDAIAGYPSMIISGAPATAYILTSGIRGSNNGGLQRRVTSATSYDFPIGTSTHGFNALRMNFTNIPSGGGLVMGKFNDGTDNPNGFVGTVSEQCFGCTSNNPAPDNTGYNRYFSSNPCNSNTPQWVTIQDGIEDHGYWSFASSGNDQSYQYSVEAFPNSFINIGNLTDAWRTLKYAASYGTNPSAATVDWGAAIDSVSTINDLLSYTLNTGDCYTGNGVPGGSYTGFGHFTMKMGSSGNALPVELLYAKAVPVNNKVIDVDWATSLEINNHGFEVTRSTDGVNFANIGWVEGHDNSTVQNDYAFTDNKVAPDTVYYYRLNQADNNGIIKQSQIVSAMLTGTGVGITISDPMPNPTVSYSRINVNSPLSQEMSVKVVDMLGQTVSNQKVDLTIGDNTVSFNLDNVTGGTYSAVLAVGGVSLSKIIMVTK